ncbi:MAG TPA: CpsB/CapC family capsule biosynthesis tyrosine phosphatase [Gemmatimonadota bacterium]|nr:CpsB/CapC family capsule biosynthesis tyrosine phosphatase [Gemmatimonadota bacterium]
MEGSAPAGGQNGVFKYRTRSVRRHRDSKDHPPPDALDVAFTDLHCHLMPGVDDGARDAAAAREAVQALGRAGVRRVVATPHLDAMVLADPAARARRMAEFEMGWRLLERVRKGLADEVRDARSKGGVGPSAPPRVPEIVRGAEIKLNVPDVDLADERTRLGGGPAILVEFPLMEIPVYAGRQLRALREAGWTPVLAHLERYDGVARILDRVEGWRKEGTVVQVNAGSLVGRHGRGARSNANRLLKRSLVDLVASDYHARGPVGIQDAWEALLDGTAHEGGSPVEVARLLLGENPRRVLEGQPPQRVPPLKLAGGLRRLLGR